MIAVDGCRHRNLLLARLHELKERHLRCGVLHRHPVRAQLDVALAALDLGVGRGIEVAVEDLLGEGQRPAEPLAHRGQAPAHLLVGVRNEIGCALDLRHLVGLSVPCAGVQPEVTYFTDGRACQPAGCC